jgi:FMN phosphatase YigB (HAD superfamily)
LEFAGNVDPATCAMLDDSVNNLAPAKKMGIFTVWVGENGTHPMADRTLLDIIDLPNAVPEFWA